MFGSTPSWRVAPANTRKIMAPSLHNYRPQTKFWGKVIFSVACVKNSVQRGGSASVHAGIPSLDQAPPPRADSPPRPGNPPPGADTTPRPGTPLRSACWEIRSTSGRYASYWNAILLVNSRRTV